LRLRLNSVADFQRLSAKKTPEVESIHQLRVATRRAEVGLSIFADVLPPRRAARLSKHLRKIRRMAGKARDLDVQVERLQEFAIDGRSAPLKMLLSHLEHQRKDLQRTLVAAWRRTSRDEFRSEAKRTVRKIGWRNDEAEPAFRSYARARLSLYVDPFIRASQQDLHCIEKVHELRKTGKQLRYAFELLGTAYPHGAVRAVVANLQRLQNRLGDINDHAVAEAMFRKLAAAADDNQLAEWLSVLADQAASFLELAWGRFLVEWHAAWADELEMEFSQLVDLELAERGETREDRRA
jgi:CHAD domain-containing protein